MAKMQNISIIPIIIFLLKARIRKSMTFALTKGQLILYKSKNYA